MPHTHFDIADAARQEMIHEGFDPNFAPGTDEQIAQIRSRPFTPTTDVRDLRALLWSSIDNDTSKDLDQIEYAETVKDGVRVLVGIADVDSAVDRRSPIDEHAASQTTSVYTGVRTFPMLPEQLSTDMTSLNEGGERLAVVMEALVASDGSIAESSIYRALVRNKAQLTYSAVGAWLEGAARAPNKVTGSAELEQQLRLQDEAAEALRAQRHRLGALDFDRTETEAVVTNGEIQGLQVSRKTRASALIEDFMVMANEVMAQTLRKAGVSTIRRVVRTPERWPRMVQLAEAHGGKLPEEPDAGALNRFLQEQKSKDPVHYADLSLAFLKLMGPGEYVMAKPGDEQEGHFGLAAHDYTHSTAPNRRFADLVTQRLIKSVLDRNGAVYSDDELAAVARNCTLREDAARKVERVMAKRIAAVALQGRIGQTFAGVATGVTPKGTFVRVFDPPVEGRLIRGEEGVDVGDRLRVKLVGTDAERGYIDFSREQ